MKKIISIILVFALCFGVTAFSVDAYLGSINRVPIILVGGRNSETPFYNAEGEKVYPPDNLNADTITDAVMQCLPYLASGALTGDYGPWIDEFYNVLAPYFEDIILDEKGELTGKSLKNEFIYDKKNPKRNGSNGCDYTFNYDWRMDPADVADELEAYIDCILESTGEEKVSLEGRCFGTNMVLAYLYEYGNEKIDSVVMYVGTLNGHGIVTDLFTGDFNLDINVLNRYVNSGFDVSSFVDDPVVSALLNGFIKLLTTLKAMNIPLDVLSDSIEKIYLDCAPRVVMATFGTFPSIWSCVASDEYETAKKIVFAGQRDKYSVLIDKIDHLQYDILSRQEEILKDLQNKGLRIAFVVKSNIIAGVPIGSFSYESGDDSVSVHKATLGAVAAPLGETLSEKYLASADMTYVSSDKMIDASTAAFRDTTWIIKDCPHSIFSTSIDKLMLEYFNSKKEMTVFDNSYYPQFLKFDSETEEISPLNDKAQKEEGFFARLIRRIIEILKIFVIRFD